MNKSRRTVQIDKNLCLLFSITHIHFMNNGQGNALILLFFCLLQINRWRR